MAPNICTIAGAPANLEDPASRKSAAAAIWADQSAIVRARDRPMRTVDDDVVMYAVWVVIAWLLCLLADCLLVDCSYMNYWPTKNSLRALLDLLQQGRQLLR